MEIDRNRILLLIGSNGKEEVFRWQTLLLLSLVVFEPKKMHPLELQEKFFWAFKKFYSLRRKPFFYPVCRYIVNRWYKTNRETLADLRKRFGSAVGKSG